MTSKRNTMSREAAKKIARQMIKKKASGYTGKASLAKYNDGKPFTDSAACKILKEFRMLVIESKDYPVLERMYCEDNF